MKPSSNRLNISKSYLVDKPFKETSEQLLAIVSEKFKSSKYSIFGNLVSVDPLEFQFMTKWVAIGPLTYTEITSTKVLVTLSRVNDKSRMDIKTRTNPSIIIFAVFVAICISIGMFRVIAKGDVTILIIYILLALGTYVFDRIVKNTVIGSFERDMGLIKK